MLNKFSLKLNLNGNQTIPVFYYIIPVLLSKNLLQHEAILYRLLKKKGTPLTKLSKAQQFCLKVKELAKEYDLPFFIVTDGASAVVNQDCDAVHHARQAHIQWEKENNLNPDHDWIRHNS